MIIQRHNEVRDAFGDLSALVWKQVRHEPVVKEADNGIGPQALIADLAVRGVWMPQVEALFDIRVIDTNAKSYSSLTPGAVLARAEKEKKEKYSSACEQRRAVFTPLCVSVDGMFGRETNHFLRRLGERLSVKWEMSVAQVMGWVRARLSFAILQAAILCL